LPFATTATVSADFESTRTSALYFTFGARTDIAFSIAEQIAAAPPDSGGNLSPFSTRQGRAWGALIAGTHAATAIADARMPAKILLHIPCDVSPHWLTVADPFVKFLRYFNA
jgi:hypothetical protein